MYDEFILDLEKWNDYGLIFSETKNDYNGIIDVDINLIKYNDNNYYDYDIPEFNYRLCFSYDERNWGFCECTPDMKDYREDKHCCGHGCDADFCSFSLHKIINIANDTWHGDEHDYWEFEDEFYKDDKELAKKKKEEERKRQINELKKRIEEDSKKLLELENEY